MESINPYRPKINQRNIHHIRSIYNSYLILNFYFIFLWYVYSYIHITCARLWIKWWKFFYSLNICNMLCTFLAELMGISQNEIFHKQSKINKHKSDVWMSKLQAITCKNNAKTPCIHSLLCKWFLDFLNFYSQTIACANYQ